MTAPAFARLEWSVALLGVALAALIVWRAPQLGPVVLIVTLALGALIAWIVVQDLKAFTISDAAVLSVAVLAGAYRWSAAAWSGEPGLATGLAIVVDAGLPGGALLLFREIYYRSRGFDGLGLGDVKLAAAGGLLVGAVGFSWALFAASALGLGIVAISRLLARAKWLVTPLSGSDRLAFGAILAPALWGVWITQQMPILLPFAQR